MNLLEIISPQNRARDPARDPFPRLVQAVDNWATDIYTTSATDKRLILNSIPQFKYTGTMYRIVFVYDEGDLTDMQKIKNHIVENRHGINLMSWSKNMAGIKYWNNGIPDGDGEENIEDQLYGNEVRVMEVLITQQGPGFDIDAFHKYAEQHKDEFPDRHFRYKMGTIERAANIQEVAAPLSNQFNIKITDEMELNYSEEDRDYIRQQREYEKRIVNQRKSAR
jgi:hypothetical protein